MSRRTPAAPGLPLGIRLLGGVVAGAYAVFAIGSGLDRAAVQTGIGMLQVPDFFAARSLVIDTNAQLQSGNIKGALQSSTTAVARAPVEAESLAYYGLSQEMAGNKALAAKAFTLAAQLGWRVPITQLYWFNQAMLVNDYRVAALRLDAFLRIYPAALSQREIIGPLEANPAAWPALLDRLALRPIWLANYTDEIDGLPVDRLVTRAQILNQLAARGVVLGCKSVAGLADRLVQGGKADLAKQLWRAHCPDSADGVVMDGNFASTDLSGPQPVLRWNALSQDGDLHMELVPLDEHGAQALSVTNATGFTASLIAQTLVAAPGAYDLRWMAQGDGDAGSDVIYPKIGCDADHLETVAGARDTGKGHWQARIQIDGRCATHVLQFSAKPSSSSVTLGAIAMVPAR